MADEHRFKVIIAGGSVVGLTLANALEKAGVDYVVLEKRDIAPQVGASISVLCHTARVFEQLGVWPVMRDATLPLLDRQHFDEHGRLFEDSGLFRLITGRTKRPFLFMERQFYLKTLYDNLAERAPVRSRCGIADFTETDDGVRVVTDDGEVIEGSILVGADGIHSNVRGLVAKGLERTDPTAAKAFREAFTARYKTLFGTSRNCSKKDPNTPLMPGGMVQNVYYRNFSGVAAAGAEGKVFWFLFVKLDTPVHGPGSVRYTDSDINATLERYGHYSLGAGYTFQDLWESRIQGGMVPMEEGVVETKWNSGGRVVLMGDAVYKSTINVGLGGNTAVEGVVRFANGLVELLKQTKQPAREQIAALFDRYEEEQRPRARLCVNLSHYVTRFEAMDTWWLRLLRIMSPWIPDSLKAKGFLDFMAPAPIFEFLPNPDA